VVQAIAAEEAELRAAATGAVGPADLDDIDTDDDEDADAAFEEWKVGVVDVGLCVVLGCCGVENSRLWGWGGR